MGRRPSAGTVIAIIALFVSLSAPAMAALIVSSNSEVAAHTIAGSAAPAGDHKNLIPNSIGTSDLHDGIVTARKLHLPRIDFSGRNTDKNSNPHHVILSLDRLTLAVSCTAGTDFYLYGSSQAKHGTLRGLILKGQANTSALSTFVKGQSLTSKLTLVGHAVGGSTPLLMEGVLTYRDSKRVISITLDGVVDSRRCGLDGTAVPAPN